MNRGVHLFRFWIVLLCCLGIVSGCSDSTPPPSNSVQLSIKTPVRLAGAGAATVFISDYGNNSVLEMRLADQELTSEIKISGKPTGLAWTTAEIFVGNESTGNIEVYDIDTGQYLRRLGTADGLFTLPNAVAVDEGLGIVFAVDTAAGLIRQFNVDGTSAGSDLGVGALSNPTAITIDETNQWIYVSDYGEPVSAFGDTPAIHVIPYGASSPAIVRIEGVNFDFDRPQGLTLNNDKLFIVESVAGKVIVFDISDLSSLSQLPAIGSGELKLPLDVYVDPVTDDLYVTSSANGEIVVFAGGGA